MWVFDSMIFPLGFMVVDREYGAENWRCKFPDGIIRDNAGYVFGCSGVDSDGFI